ncbi:MAG: TonB-dependent receptor, partial [Muribaculaceae bacterium]|nr:TonB-dependent receptor [Muribaculaceae bacterium]
SIRQFAGYQYSPKYYSKSRYQLVSFFGRVNYTLMDRYLLTATMRWDGTSRFGKDNRWGTFPAVALGWKILEEDFMEGARGVLSELKLRAEYGVTGQQNLGGDYFPYLPIYSILNYESNTYPIGINPDGTPNYVQIAYPEKYNADLKWEETHTWNVGVDFGFLNNRINGSIDWYRRKSTDLLVWANFPAGSNLSNVGNINLGDLTNTGIEFNINTRPVVTRDFTWNSNLNFAWNRNKITRLAEGADTTTGGVSGINVQKHVVGEAAYTYWVYEQVYDANGNPLEGVYVDQNADGVINNDDRILYHHATPDITVAWNNTFKYKNWDLGFVLRGAFGNWAYNQNMMNNSFVSATATAPLSNILDNTYLFETTRSTDLMLSNHWVQNASFVRCDNITLGYTWDNLLRDKLRLRVFGAVENPFVITGYKGLDPELTYQHGIDNSCYPRPVTFTLGLVANF